MTIQTIQLKQFFACGQILRGKGSGLVIRSNGQLNGLSYPQILGDIRIHSSFHSLGLEKQGAYQSEAKCQALPPGP
jgi:hypothetical protein